MTINIISETISDLNSFVSQIKNDVDLTETQEKDYQSTLHTINEFSTFLNGQPDSVTPDLLNYTYHLATELNDEILGIAKSDLSEGNKAKLSNASSALFKLSKSINLSLQQQETKAPTNTNQPVNAQSNASYVDKDISALSIGTDLGVGAAGFTIGLASTLCSALSKAAMKGYAITNDYLNSEITSNFDPSYIQNNLRPHQFLKDDLASKKTAEPLALKAPDDGFSGFKEKQSDMKYLNDLSGVVDSVGLLEDLSKKDQLALPHLKNKSVQSLLTGIDELEETSNNLSDKSRDKFEQFNKLIKECMDNSEINSESFSEEVRNKLKDVLEKLKEVFKNILGGKKGKGLDFS